MMKLTKMTNYVAYVFLGFIGLVALIVALAFSPLGIKLLVNIANKQEGLELKEVSGSFYSQVIITDLAYSNEQIEVRGNKLKLDISLNCLFLAEACIQELDLGQLDIVLLENNVEAPPPSEPLSDYIELPIRASLEKFRINSLTVGERSLSGERQKIIDLTELSAALSMQSVLQVDYIRLQQGTFYQKSANVSSAEEDAQEDLSAKQSFEELLAALRKYQYEPIAIPQLFVPINANINEIMLQEFCIKQTDSMCINNTVLNLNLSQQKLEAAIGTTIVEQIVDDFNATISVDFAQQYTHSVALDIGPNLGVLKKNGQDVENHSVPKNHLFLSLNGNAKGTNLTIKSGSLAPIVKLQASADLGQQNLPVDFTVSSGDFLPIFKQWLPKVYMPVSAFDLSLIGNADSYALNTHAQVVGELPSSIDLTTEISLSNKRLLVSQLSTSGDLGQLQGTVSAALNTLNGKDSIVTKVDLNFSEVKLKPLVPELDAQLNGRLKTELNANSVALWGTLNCDNIRTFVQGIDLSLVCDISLNEAGIVKVNSLRLSQGKNTIGGKGSFEFGQALNTNNLLSNTATQNNDILNKAKSQLVLDINIPKLATMYPKAQGSILGKANISGKASAPKVSLNLNILALVFDDIKIQEADLLANIDAFRNWQTTVILKAREMSAETLIAQQININAEGNASKHQVNIDLTHPEYSMSHEIVGGINLDQPTWLWQGEWRKGVFASAFDSLILDQAAKLVVAQEKASISAHCWLASSASANVSTRSSSQQKQGLCINTAEYSEELTQVDANIDYDLSVPLLHFLPDIIKPGSTMPVHSNIDLGFEPVKGLQLEAYQLITQAKLVTSKHNIDLVAVVANLELENGKLHSNVFAGSKEKGALGFSSELVLDPENRIHQGQLRINDFDLSPFQRFIPTIEKLAGIIEGNVNFSGPMLKPDVTGILMVNDGQVVLDNYPYPITSFNQTIDIVNNVVDIQGEFELGAGSAEYSANIDFAKDLLIKGKLAGAGMQIAVDEHDLLASPNLTFSLTPTQLSLKGDIVIPNASINIKELPPSAKSPSSDTLIIGQEPEPPIVPIGLDVDLNILIDPPKLKRVKINALDLSASLNGDLRLKVLQKYSENETNFAPMQTYLYGSLNILDGSYEAYGQNLQIKQGAIYFSGSPELPQFDITAIRNPLNTADNVIAGLRITGNPVIPSVELFSEPAMIQAQQLSYLLQGTKIEGGESDSNNVILVNALVSFGVGSSENGVNRLGKSLGFDSLNIQTAGQGENTQVQLTGRISDNIQVTYGVGLFDQASEMILKYQFFPKLFLEAKSGATIGVDLFYELSRGE